MKLDLETNLTPAELSRLLDIAIANRERNYEKIKKDYGINAMMENEIGAAKKLSAEIASIPVSRK